MTSSASPALTHVVWDWNGTLLDDFDLTARIAGRTMASLGVQGLTADDIRSGFRRPFSAFYASLLGRPVTPAEFAFVRKRYEIEYEAEVFGLGLQPDADTALDVVGAQASQSLLSMAPDMQLQQLIDHHRIRERFVLVEGSPRNDSDGNKADRLGVHLRAIEVDPEGTVVIGDTVDDHEAAQAHGLRSVLVTTGSTNRDQLEATGAPVVDTLLEAARIALRGLGRRPGDQASPKHPRPGVRRRRGSA